MQKKDLLEEANFQHLERYSFVEKKVKLLPYAFAKQKIVLPLEEREESFIVAIGDIMDFELRQEVEWLLKKNIEWLNASIEKILSAIELCYHVTEEESAKLFKTTTKILERKNNENEVEGYDLLDRDENNPLIHLLNTIILEAIEQKASDIHFEPQENELMIRYRIDGILVKRRSPPLELQSNLLTRLKIMSKLDIAEKRLPQDGRMKLFIGSREIDFRVSTIPIIYGERITLRILDKTKGVFGLEQLGLSSLMHKMLCQMLELPEGILLVTGPTGSGKTTTLYSMLSQIHSTEVNIMTIEDPIEYKLMNIGQIGVNPKIDLTFARGLRHILRQDPDIIMIGEIRDKETAEIAMQSSLTGHLVLSTLHTNDAASAIPRLIDMGIEPYLLSSSLLGVIAQRLVRQICQHCKVRYLPLEEEWRSLGFTKSPGYWSKGAGCEKCLHTGYKGRKGIFEFFKISSSIRMKLLKCVDADQLRVLAKEEGMIDLFSHGVKLVEEGITTSSEVLRVTKSGL